jgi:hypothetical protein
LALQLLLHTRRLPQTQDAAVAAVPRAQGLSRHLSELVGVNRRTIERWREWWRDTFTASPFWQIGRATFMPAVDQDRLPVSLIERFTGSGAERLMALLHFMGPITGGQAHAR